MTTIEPGDTFLYPYPGDRKHLHIIIEKIIDKNVCLCVFVSSIRSGKGYDASCVLNAGDCSFIRHPSYVVYDKMQLFDVHHLTRMVENGQITIHRRCPEIENDNQPVQKVSDKRQSWEKLRRVS